MSQPPSSSPDAGLRPWRSRSIPAPQRQAFLEQLTAGNLRRMFWFILVCFPISLWFFLSNELFEKPGGLSFWSLFDLGLAIIFLIANLHARRKQPPLLWKRGVVLAYCIYSLASMTGYYFTTLEQFGENQTYVLGLVMVAVLFRLPPRQFLALLLANHLAFVVLVCSLTLAPNGLFAALIGGLDALLVACLAAYFLFTREWQDFQKGWLLTARTRELEAANNRLQRRQEEMNELMAIAAHDLRSPLYNVADLFGLLQKQEDWNREPYRRVLTECRGAFQEMIQLIGRLLDAHAAESGSAGSLFHRQPTDAEEVLLRVAARYQPVAESRGVTLRTEAVPCPLVTAPAALEQALDNLVSNALRFSPKDSTVFLSLSATPGACRLTVADEGPGVSPEDVPILFRKFHKGRRAPLHNAPGTGLGLFIVEKVALQLGGRVWYEPQVPHGAGFHLELPRASTNDATTTLPPACLSPNPGMPMPPP